MWRVAAVTSVDGRQEVGADEDVGDVERRLDDGGDEQLQRVGLAQDDPERDEHGSAGEAAFQDSRN